MFNVQVFPIWKRSSVKRRLLRSFKKKSLSIFVEFVSASLSYISPFYTISLTFQFSMWRNGNCITPSSTTISWIKIFVIVLLTKYFIFTVSFHQSNHYTTEPSAGISCCLTFLTSS